ncbi:MAG: glycosyltransferase [Synergistaceae bacterium]|nr:glycosyltransferase [Synergistaceae bacterium]
MAEVDILLAAYNGEKFIAEQIESILAQTYQDFRLIIRDDDSTDNTPAIIEEYAARYPDKIQVVHDDAVCRSAAANFFQLLTYASADYVMFSDQDDYWLPYKVQALLWHMKEAERANPRKPVMVFTGFEVVDKELHSMKIYGSVDVPEYLYSFTTMLMMNNCVAGCTEMINRVLYKNIGGYDERCGYHDAFTALYASAVGVIVYLTMQSIKYRQHDNNDIGYTGGGGQ